MAQYFQHPAALGVSPVRHDDAVVRRGILTEDMAFLQKPFSASALLEKAAALIAPPR